MTQEQTTLILNTVPNKVARECILKKGLYHKKGVSFKKKKVLCKVCCLLLFWFQSVSHSSYSKVNHYLLLTTLRADCQFNPDENILLASAAKRNSNILCNKSFGVRNVITAISNSWQLRENQTGRNL